MALAALIAALLRLLKPYWPQALVVFVALLIDIAFFNLWPLSFKYLVEDAVVPKNREALIKILSVLAAGVAVASIAQMVRDYLYARIASHLLNDLRLTMFRKLQDLSAGFFARADTGDLLARFSTDLANVEKAVTLSLPGFVYSSIGLVISAVILFELEWRLALMTVAGLPACFIGPRVLAPLAAKANGALKDGEARIISAVQENVRAQPLVKVLGLAAWSIARFTALLDQVLKTGMRYRVLAFMVVRTPNVSVFVLQLLVIGLGAMMAFDGAISVGALFSVHGMFLNVSYSVTELTSGVPFLLDAGGGVKRMEGLLGEAPAVADRPDGRPLPPFSREIAFENVSFSYGGEGGAKNLDGVSLVIRRGTSAAFVGTSGSGKSTIVNLITRFYDPTEGRVTFDGVDLRDAAIAPLRRQLGVVMQDNFMFNLSIRDNLRLAKPDATEAEIIAAARDAEIHDIVTALPQGYDTPAGEGGGRLSGGQRQRLAIARALLAAPEILVLDEATSALDAATESAITRTLERLRGRHTLIQVTHRLAAAQTADHIFVMDKGRVAEDGTHAQLLAQDGLYAQLWSKQSGLGVSEDGLHATVDTARLRGLPILEKLATDILEELAGRFVTERFVEGRDIIHEGDPGDKFYIIVRGKVAVLKSRAEGPPAAVATLQDGDYFGEIALLRDVPRTATIRAVTDCVLLSLDRGQFLRLMNRDPALRAHLAELAAARAVDSKTLYRA